MDKIVELLKGIGASDELADQVCEELKRFQEQVYNECEETYNKKLEKAKKLCVEEVNSYKADLASKVSLFLESKANRIDERMEGLKAIEEGKAMSKLRSMKQIVEDIEVADDSELQALKKKIETLSEEKKSLLSDKKRAEEAANRANKMALELLENQKKTKPVVEEKDKEIDDELENVDLEGGEDIDAELDCVDLENCDLDESKKTKGKVVTEEKTEKPAKRKAAKPKTTRRTLVENQTRKTTKKRGSDDIAAIAETL